jgi:hypothetical protein
VRTRFNANEGTGSACKAKDNGKREISPHHVVLKECEDVAGRMTPVAHDPQRYYNSEEPSDVKYDDAALYQRKMSREERVEYQTDS